MNWNRTLVTQKCKQLISINQVVEIIDLHLKLIFFFGFSVFKMGAACLPSLLHRRWWVMSALPFRIMKMEVWSKSRLVGCDWQSFCYESSVNYFVGKIHDDGFEYFDERSLGVCFSVKNVHLNRALAPYKMAESDIPVSVRVSDFAKCFFFGARRWRKRWIDFGVDHRCLGVHRSYYRPCLRSWKSTPSLIRSFNWFIFDIGINIKVNLSSCKRARVPPCPLCITLVCNSNQSQANRSLQLLFIEYTLLSGLIACYHYSVDYLSVRDNSSLDNLNVHFNKMHLANRIQKCCHHVHIISSIFGRMP